MISCSWLRLVGAERGGRLVHHDQLRVARERAQDLDLLLLGRAQPAGRERPRQVEPGRLGQLRRSARLSRRLRTNDASRGSTPRKTFCATVSCGTTDGSCAIAATPCSSASRGERNETSLAVEEHPPAVGAVDARDDLPERRLAGAVLADERVDRAAPDGERHARERLDAAEVLGDVLELEVRTFCRLRSSRA